MRDSAAVQCRVGRKEAVVPRCWVIRPAAALVRSGVCCRDRCSDGCHRSDPAALSRKPNLLPHAGYRVLGADYSHSRSHYKMIGLDCLWSQTHYRGNIIVGISKHPLNCVLCDPSCCVFDESAAVPGPAGSRLETQFPKAINPLIPIYYWAGPPIKQRTGPAGDLTPQ